MNVTALCCGHLSGTSGRVRFRTQPYLVVETNPTKTGDISWLNCKTTDLRVKLFQSPNTFDRKRIPEQKLLTEVMNFWVKPKGKRFLWIRQQFIWSRPVKEEKRRGVHREEKRLESCWWRQVPNLWTHNSTCKYLTYKYTFSWFHFLGRLLWHNTSHPILTRGPPVYPPSVFSPDDLLHLFPRLSFSPHSLSLCESLSTPYPGGISGSIGDVEACRTSWRTKALPVWPAPAPAGAEGSPRPRARRRSVLRWW